MGEKYHIEKERGQVDGKQTRGWRVDWEIKDKELLESFLEPEVVRRKLASVDLSGVTLEWLRSENGRGSVQDFGAGMLSWAPR